MLAYDLYLNVLRITITKSNEYDFLKGKNQHVFNGRTVFLVKIIELLRFLNRIKLIQISLCQVSNR